MGDLVLRDASVRAGQNDECLPEQGLAGDGSNEGLELQMSGGAAPAVQRIERAKGRQVRADPGKRLFVGGDGQAKLLGDAVKGSFVRAHFPREPGEGIAVRCVLPGLGRLLEETLASCRRYQMTVQVCAQRPLAGRAVPVLFRVHGHALS